MIIPIRCFTCGKVRERARARPGVANRADFSPRPPPRPSRAPPPRSRCLPSGERYFRTGVFLHDHDPTARARVRRERERERERERRRRRASAAPTPPARELCRRQSALAHAPQLPPFHPSSTHPAGDRQQVGHVLGPAPGRVHRRVSDPGDPPPELLSWRDRARARALTPPPHRPAPPPPPPQRGARRARPQPLLLPPHAPDARRPHREAPQLHGGARRPVKH